MGVFADRVLESSTVTGTGDATLSGTRTGYRTFNAAVGTNVLVHYTIAHTAADEWEIGEGYLSSSTVLVRNLVMSSSNGGALVNFSAGTKDVFCTVPADEIASKAMSYALRMNLAGV